MKELDVTYRPGRDYRELFDIAINNNNCTTTCIGITNEGDLLYVKSKLMNNSSAYWEDFTCYSIDKTEFRKYLSVAKSNGNVEKAIRNGYTTAEELEKLGNT